MLLIKIINLSSPKRFKTLIVLDHLYSCPFIMIPLIRSERFLYFLIFFTLFIQWSLSNPWSLSLILACTASHSNALHSLRKVWHQCLLNLRALVCIQSLWFNPFLCPFLGLRQMCWYSRINESHHWVYVLHCELCLWPWYNNPYCSCVLLGASFP